MTSQIDQRDHGHSPGVVCKPPLPPQSIEKRHTSVKFPKTFLEWLNYPRASLSNYGLIGQQPQRHVVLCGFPRAGTTLLQLIVQACIEDVQGFPTETRALHMARFATKRASYLFTKCPGDIFQIDRILAYYEGRQTRPKILLMMRDPRSVMTSFHSSRPGKYSCSTERWLSTWNYWAWANQFSQVQVVRYEDLVCRPTEVEAHLAEHIGWSVQRPFDRFHERVADDFRTTALNGLRPLDPSTLTTWRDPRHASRLQQIVRELPDLPAILCQLGYETDDAWLTRGDSQPAAAA